MSDKEPKVGWFEHYRCGCVSEIVRTKKELAGYCGKHGDNRMEAPFRVHPHLEKFDQPPKKRKAKP